MDALKDRFRGVLLGVALGDALGLPVEGLTARTIARRFGRIDRFRLLGQTGFVSDDTELSALIAQSLARHPTDVELCVGAFRRALLGWFSRLPWGIGMATLRSCFRVALRIRPSGVHSAGNGAAMRAAAVGAFFHDRPREREIFGRSLSEVTHRDARAIEGALYVAEMTAACVERPAGMSLADCQSRARQAVRHAELGHAIDRARTLSLQGVDTATAAQSIGTTGFVVHTVAFATFCLLRFGDEPMLALTEAISAGGDADSIGAILGGWLGARHGESGLPGHLIARIHNGPFGPSHLRDLAGCLVEKREGRDCAVPRYSVAAATGRNLALYPVILGHGLRQLVPL
ncbi:MAG: ADP-ribosylglycohydrolase family protein [Isosphaeraceae bacterium]